jgi:hypothetical protein
MPDESVYAPKQLIGRLRIWTDGQTITYLGHIPEGFGKMKTELEWEQTPPEKRPYSMRDSLHSSSHTPFEVEGYFRLGKGQELNFWDALSDLWDALSDLAIEKWLERTRR